MNTGICLWVKYITMKTLDKILDFSSGEKFYRFGNSDGKYWIMPARNMRTAMNLYQPSGSKGKMVKSLLPCLHRLPPVRKAIHATTMHCCLKSEICGLLCEIFGTKDFEFAIFEGTPSVHQKITMQISCKGKILGYCKLSENNDIKVLFEKESDILTRLAECGVKNIPQALHGGTLKSGMHIFVQSTAKSVSSRVIHEWSGLHEDFLSQMHERTKQLVPFEESDCCKSIDAIGKAMDNLPDCIDRKVIATAIADIHKEFDGKAMELSAYHGDFTPWNMFANGKELFVFDFEYAAMSYPKGLDRYHFFTQTAIFERHWNANDITAFIESDNGKWIDKKLYTIYLLDMISRFTLRENGKVSGKAATPFALWGKILESLMVNN